MASGRAVAGEGARRSVSTPLRRGAAVVAVTGGAASLVAVSLVTAVTPIGAAVGPVAQVVPAEADRASLPSAVQPVAPDPNPIDAAELVKAVQLTEQEVARLAAEERVAQEKNKAAAEKAAQEKAAAQDKEAQDKEAPKRAASARPAAASGPPECGLDTSGLGAVKAHVRDAAEFLGCLFGEPTMLGVAGRAGASDHPAGKAVDFMVDRATGDGLAACALRNKEALGITYVIWRQRINHGSGWKSMDDRGGVTANHFDHVHVSFGSGAGSGRPAGC